MVEKLNTRVSLPVWFVGAIIPVLVSILIFSVVNIRSQANAQATTSTEIRNIEKRLDRIENKLDNHIIKVTN